MQIERVMAVSLTPNNKQTLRRLLKTGRWNNESEILRYGLHLVESEVRREDTSPLPAGVLAASYKQQSAEEKAQEARMSKASIRHRPNKKDLDR